MALLNKYVGGVQYVHNTWCVVTVCGKMCGLVDC